MESSRFNSPSRDHQQMETSRSDSPADANGDDANVDVRPSKRRRLEEEADTTTSNADPNTLHLTPDLWAVACDFLPYSDLLTTALVSRSMLRETMPCVKVLHIERTGQLHVGPTGRFQDVQDVFISCVLMLDESIRNGEDEDDEIHIPTEVDGDATGRVVPFLCRFPKLERAFLGGLTSDGYFTGYCTFYSTTGKHLQRLIVALSGAFRSGALPSNLWIGGLCCPNALITHRQRTLDLETQECDVCYDACRSFPLQSVIDFESGGASSRRFYFDNPGMICSLDVCLDKEGIQEIIARRPGGTKFLKSPQRILDLLKRGTLRILQPDKDEGFNESKPKYVVKYSSDEEYEIDTAISKVLSSRGGSRSSIFSGIARSHEEEVVHPHEVEDAIMRSFAGGDDKAPVPPRDQCYLAWTSFVFLKDLGVPIDFMQDRIYGVCWPSWPMTPLIKYSSIERPDPPR